MQPLPFYDREEELTFLESIYKKNSFQVVVLYGRRRVGKSELVKQFITGKDAYYYLCTNEGIRENLNMMIERIAELPTMEYFQDLRIQ